MVEHLRSEASLALDFQRLRSRSSTCMRLQNDSIEAFDRGEPGSMKTVPTGQASRRRADDRGQSSARAVELVGDPLVGQSHCPSPAPRSALGPAGPPGRALQGYADGSSALRGFVPAISLHPSLPRDGAFKSPKGGSGWRRARSQRGRCRLRILVLRHFATSPMTRPFCLVTVALEEGIRADMRGGGRPTLALTAHPGDYETWQ